MSFRRPTLHKAPPTPERSFKQRTDALARANEIRSQRAQLKRDLKAGRHSIHQMLLDPPEFLETAKVFDMRSCSPSRDRTWGPLTHCRISPSKTIGDLSERQRAELVSMLHR